MTRSLLLAAAVAAGALATSAHADMTATTERSYADYIRSLESLIQDNQKDLALRLRLAGVLEARGLREEANQVLRELAAIEPRFMEVLSPAEGMPYSEFSNGCGETGLRAAGPDVIVGDLPSIGNYTGTSPVSGRLAFSLATTSCNPGTALLNWIQNSNDHPVIMQNFYRLKGGRFEQIGASWLKHGFCALQLTVCGTCSPAGGGCVSALGLGCSDPYSASLNGDQTNLGPRSQVNASTGVYPWPYSPQFSGGTTLDRRISVLASDMDPAQNSGAQYIAEGVYVAKDDARAGNGFNNASYRPFTFIWSGQGVATISMSGSTTRQKAAIEGWKDIDPTVSLVNVFTQNEGYYETNPPNTSVATGRFIVAWKVTNNGNGTWTYDYAAYNFNSDRSAASFNVKIPNTSTLTNVQFRGVNVAGEPYDTTDWTFTRGTGVGGWASTQTFAQNANANALRWGTMFNFRFTADTAPVSYVGGGRIDAFKPSTPAGGPGSYSFDIQGPACVLPGDLNADQVVNFSDLSVVLSGFGTTYTFNDLSQVLASFGRSCF